MDTDSAYLSISSDTLDGIVKPHMREEYYRNYGDWFPKPFCQDHADDFLECKLTSQGGEWIPGECCKRVLKHDIRTPCLFTEEFVGDGMVALNYKTYFCSNDEGSSKYSSKGLSKRTNQLTKENFLHVLRSGKSKHGTNKGFVRKDNTTYTYDQLKTGLTYF